MTTLYAAALIDITGLMKESMRGAITTGITPEPYEPTTAATVTPCDEPAPSGNVLARVRRLVAGPAARPKAVDGSPC